MKWDVHVTTDNNSIFRTTKALNFRWLTFLFSGLVDNFSLCFFNLLESWVLVEQVGHKRQVQLVVSVYNILYNMCFTIVCTLNYWFELLLNVSCSETHFSKRKFPRKQLFSYFIIFVKQHVFVFEVIFWWQWQLRKLY